MDVMKIVLDDGAIMPTRGHPTDAGLDLYCREEFVLWPWHHHEFDTGVHIQLLHGWHGHVVGRSGLNMADNIACPTGIIDEEYTGSIVVKLYNLGKRDKVFHAGDRIGQLILLPCYAPALTLVDALDATDRGVKGFGSTGR